MDTHDTIRQQIKAMVASVLDESFGDNPTICTSRESIKKIVVVNPLDFWDDPEENIYSMDDGEEV